MKALAALLLALALALASPAVAQAPRSPEERQVMMELSFVLGEAHALRVACRGPDDQVWRARMSAMMEVEQADEGLRRLLVERFNAGFASRQAEAGGCAAGTPAQERAAAARGKALAERLAGG